MNRKTSVTATFLVAGVVALFLLGREPALSRRPGDRLPVLSSTVIPSGESVVDSAMTALHANHESMIDKWPAGEESTGRVECPASRDGATAQEDAGAKCDFASAYKQNGYDLVELFLSAPDSVSIERLVRNASLNPQDREVDTATIDELRQIVGRYHPRFESLIPNYRNARNLEAESVIRGAAAPAVPTLGSDLVPAYAKSHLADEQRRRPALTLEAYTQELMQNPPAAPIRGAYICVDGRKYAFAWFKDLPTSDRMYDDILFFGAQYLAEVSQLFERRGFAHPATVTEILRRASGWDTKSVRGAR